MAPLSPKNIHDRAQDLLTLVTRDYFRGDYAAAVARARALEDVMKLLAAGDRHMTVPSVRANILSAGPSKGL